ncbi:hypothetical protein Pmar_PMAR022279 [Perkinsus marinus ATCC 50983]|uniref:Uncharacterized protein n=1 Tax=Perkinsus marinus (strain ATCC 50983 / TXsc) TaxID=423536 RepID=C5KDN8_PERM5|nr:hypothetical protein Pmar_PMAR022279 [Perkinsus marinus ATCC 50983]EER17341.1 hypothetical protein Pmar_PMAR022279 [Perkinsus marinus ATCC 50983]|eukprot:XP_002785545.1 hypothetical protein Pmar_PMAR022279 [Perkinsus marinus ATCC 50983]
MLEDKLAIEKEAVSDYPTWRDYNVTILCIRFYCLLKYKVKLKARCAGVIRSFFGNIKPGTRLRYAIHKLISRARLLQRAVKFESHREISIRWIKLELDMIKMKWIAEQIDKIEDLKARIANTTAMGLPADLLELKQLEKTKAAYRSIVRPASANERAIQITVMQK